MELAWLSLAALIVIIAISCTTQQNPGAIALALAWILGAYVAEWLGHPVGGTKAVVAGFPAELFLKLTGLMLLFALAAENGTLEILSRLAIKACRGDSRLLPWAFFLMTAALSIVGAGNIAAAALIAPTAIAASRHAGVPPFLMVVMLAHGALAGGLSPVSPTGALADELLTKLHLSGNGWKVCGWNFLGNALIASAAYAGLGGWRRHRTDNPSTGDCEPELRPVAESTSASIAAAPDVDDDELPDVLRHRRANRVEGRHVLTLVIIGSLLTSVLTIKADAGFAAFCGAVILIICRAADERKAIQIMPWGVTLMVCGVSTLTSLLEKTQGLQLFSELISRVATPHTVVPLMSGFTGVLSVYSSTSGVIMPVFMPLAPKLVEQMHGGNVLAICMAIIVGGHLVDSSPLSTIGALCLAPVEPVEVRQRTFRLLLVWGLSMTIVGAILCWLMFGWM